jgi:hypothetical protein
MNILTKLRSLFAAPLEPQPNEMQQHYDSIVSALGKCRTLAETYELWDCIEEFRLHWFHNGGADKYVALTMERNLIEHKIVNGL